MTTEDIRTPTNSDDLIKIAKQFGRDLTLTNYIEMENMDIKMFEKRLPTLVYYRNSPTFGHFTLTGFVPHKNGGYCLEFFNPYGVFLDNEFENPEVQKFNKYPYLCDLFDEADGKITYNHFKFQKYSADINTCGKHCISRCINNDKTLEEYKNAMDIEKKKYGSYDKVVSIYYNKLEKLI